MLPPANYMRRCFPYTGIIFSVLIFGVGCNEPFSPKGPFQQRFVAYSVLNAQSDTQFVRLYLNYNPPGFDPHAVTTEKYDTSAQLTISSVNRSFNFHDTLLAASLHTFVNQSFRPQPGTVYVLNVSSQFGTITATTAMPARGTLSLPNPSTLIFASTFPDKNVEVDATLGPETRGFLVRFLLVYSIASDSAFVGETEIPMSYIQSTTGVSSPVFPQLQRTFTPNPIVTFPVNNYLQTIVGLTDQFKTKIILKQVKFFLVQVDEGLYNYYNVVSGFQDPYSIRTDKPDYTNIQNGFGVFGSFNVDSLVIHL
jgi:hypothetical protein